MRNGREQSEQQGTNRYATHVSDSPAGLRIAEVTEGGGFGGLSKTELPEGKDVGKLFMDRRRQGRSVAEHQTIQEDRRCLGEKSEVSKMHCQIELYIMTSSILPTRQRQSQSAAIIYHEACITSLSRPYYLR